MKGLIVVMILIVSLCFGVHTLITNHIYNTNTDTNSNNTKFSVVEVEASSDIQVNPKIESIENDVVSVSGKYFEGINLTDFRVYYLKNSSWEASVYDDTDRGIYLGSDYGGDLDLYRMVFTHEYTHYILHRYNLSGWNGTLHESLAEVYTLFLNEKTEEKIWGKNAEKRDFPYNISVTPILEKNNFSCLYKVFDENDKIESVDEILTRLKEFCGIEYKEQEGTD